MATDGTELMIQLVGISGFDCCRIQKRKRARCRPQPHRSVLGIAVVSAFGPHFRMKLPFCVELLNSIVAPFRGIDIAILIYRYTN